MANGMKIRCGMLYPSVERQALKHGYRFVDGFDFNVIEALRQSASRLFFAHVLTKEQYKKSIVRIEEMVAKGLVSYGNA